MTATGDKPDWAAEGLLDGLDTEEERAARRELLEHLLADGCSIDDLKRAVADDRLALLPMERLLLQDRVYDFNKAAELTGLSVDYLQRNWRALGLPLPGPDEPSHTEQNVEGMRAVKLLLDAGLSEHEMLELTRMVGDASAKMADAIIRTVGRSLLKPGDTERDLGLRIAEIVQATLPALAPLMQGPMRAHLADAAQHEAIGQMERETGHVPGGRAVAVCFADMVGFTSLSERLEIDELGELTQRFVHIAGELADPPVRLIKTIGDEAMLASEDPEALVKTALALIDAADSDDLLPPLRAGAAAGTATRHAGDWYGPPVNLAARITAVAPERGLLGDASLREATGGSFDWHPAGRRGFKGIESEVDLYRLARG